MTITPRALLDPLREALGPDVVLELCGALVSDRRGAHAGASLRALSCRRARDRDGGEVRAAMPSRPFEEPEHGAWFGSDRPGRGGMHEAHGDFPAWRALVAGVPEAHGGALTSLSLQRRACVLTLSLGDAHVDLVLTARDGGGGARSRRLPP